MNEVGAEAGQDQQRLQRLAGAAQRELTDRGLRRCDLAELSQQTESLRDRPVFGPHPNDGIACFMAPDFVRVERVALAVEPQYLVGPRFALGPILPLLVADSRFFILALSHDLGRLFEATADAMCEVPLDPRQDAAPSAAHGSAGPRPRRNIIPMVRSSSNDSALLGSQQVAAAHSEKADIVRFLRTVDHRVHALLAGQDAPLVLASIGFLAGLYQPINSYRRLLPAKVPGNPATWSEAQLHLKASQIAEPYLRHGHDMAHQKYEAAQGARWASDDVRAIIPAADLGRVDTLFVSRAARCRGRYDPQQGRVDLDRPDDDLADIAVAKTLLYGGRVFLAQRDELPPGTPLAAIYRMSS